MTQRYLLLVSNSTMHGQGYLEHCSSRIKSFLEAKNLPQKTVLFVPFALKDHDGYAEKANAAFQEIGFKIRSIHTFPSDDEQRQAVKEAEAIFIGGGNTFRLLKTLYDKGLVQLIRKRALEDGMPYIGSSAGTNVSTISIRTTNDMPIVQPPSFDAIGLVPFNINPHYLDPDPHSTHKGETREERLMSETHSQQFHEENSQPVVGLREGAMLFVEGNKAILEGTTGGRLFLQGKTPQELTTGADLSYLLEQ